MEPEDRIRRLAPLIGEWTTTITQLDGQGGDGEVSTASDIYRWSANGRFVQHDVDARMGSEQVQSLEVIALDPDGPDFVSRSYDPDGTFSDYAATLEGRRWRVVGAVQRFDGMFSEDGGTLAGEWQQRTGDGWVPLMRVSLRKLSVASAA